MKKFILIFVLLPMLFPEIYAQSSMTFIKGEGGKSNVLVLTDSQVYPCRYLDTAIIRVNYSYAFLRDTVSGYTEKGKGTLEIGRKYSKYSDKVFFIADSTVRSSNGTNYSRLIEGADVNQLTMMEVFIHNLASDEWICTGRVVTQDFLYNDNTSGMIWNISDSVSTVSGYKAVLARCTFRGRDYTAWFTTEIPVSAGPWKFSGLPGLILSVEDREGHFVFNAESVYNTSGKIYMTEYMYLKTKRGKYMEAKTLLETRPVVAQQRYLVNSSVEIEPSRKGLKIYRPLNNDYIEKDL